MTKKNYDLFCRIHTNYNIVWEKCWVPTINIKGWYVSSTYLIKHFFFCSCSSLLFWPSKCCRWFRRWKSKINSECILNTSIVNINTLRSITQTHIHFYNVLAGFFRFFFNFRSCFFRWFCWRCSLFLIYKKL